MLVTMYKLQNFINEQYTERNKEEDLRAWQGLLGRIKYSREGRRSVRKGQKKICGQDKGTVYVYMKVAS